MPGAKLKADIIGWRLLRMAVFSHHSVKIGRDHAGLSEISYLQNRSSFVYFCVGIPTAGRALWGRQRVRQEPLSQESRCGPGWGV